MEKTLEQVVTALENTILSRLKYNYFKHDHPNSSLRGKLFKFIGEGKIQFLQTKKTRNVDKNDLSRGGEKLYTPADMY